MAALTFYACNALHLLYDLSSVFLSSGLSISRSYRYLRDKRRKYLFRKNCRQVWIEYVAATAAICAKDTIDAVEDVDGRSGGGDGGGEIVKVQQNSEFGNQSNGLHEVSLSTSVISFGESIGDLVELKEKRKKSSSVTMFKRSSRVGVAAAAGIDFAAIEATAEAQENQLRQEQAAKSLQSFEVVDNYEEIEVISGQEVDSTFYDYIDIAPVYENRDFSGLKEGVSITVTGYILLDCERFSINLILSNEYRDIALHINPRLPQNYIVRNTKVRNVWGREEVTSALPFSLKRGSKFSIQILVTAECYMISVNGYHFAEYDHRLPFQAVGALEVNGDVDHIEVERCNVDHYPDRLPESQANDIDILAPLENEESVLVNVDVTDDELSQNIPQEFKQIKKHNTLSISSDNLLASGLPLPYYGRLPQKSLIAGRRLQIIGRVKLLPHSFYINLQCGQNIWPHAIIAFHFNPRFSKQCGALTKHIICRNAWFAGAWAEEQRSELDADFRPGKTFNLVIQCSQHAYEVYVNSKLITEFMYQVKPDIVDTVYIQGDIKLWSVLVEDKALLQGQKRIYHNPTYVEEF